jgi:DNA modification methylase
MKKPPVQLENKADAILTAIQGLNAELIRDAMRLYSSDGDVVLDVTFGKGKFWELIDTNKYKFFPTDLQTGVDFTDLPYPDDFADVLVIDPPYMDNGANAKASLDGYYKNHQRQRLETKTYKGIKGVVRLYQDGLIEAQRVVKPGGYVLVKCQDQTTNWVHNEILAYAEGVLSMKAEDLFILMQKGKPLMRHDYQYHARKNHSYLWVFEVK